MSCCLGGEPGKRYSAFSGLLTCPGMCQLLFSISFSTLQWRLTKKYTNVGKIYRLSGVTISCALRFLNYLEGGHFFSSTISCVWCHRFSSLAAAVATEFSSISSSSRRGWPQPVQPRSPYPFAAWERIHIQAHRAQFKALRMNSLPLQWYPTLHMHIQIFRTPVFASCLCVLTSFPRARVHGSLDPTTHW